MQESAGLSLSRSYIIMKEGLVKLIACSEVTWISGGTAK